MSKTAINELIKIAEQTPVFEHVSREEVGKILGRYGVGSSMLATALAINIGYVIGVQAEQERLNGERKAVSESLDNLHHKSEFVAMMGKLVYENPEVKAEEDAHNEMLENLNLAFDTLDPILCSINSMMARTMDIAYKKGYLDCMDAVVYP